MMPFSNIPIRNPGRYFEQFVKVRHYQKPYVGRGGGDIFVNPYKILTVNSVLCLMNI